MLDVTQLLEIHELAARYGNVMDDREWHRLGTLFTDDAELCSTSPIMTGFELTNLRVAHVRDGQRLLGWNRLRQPPDANQSLSGCGSPSSGWSGSDASTSSIVSATSIRWGSSRYSGAAMSTTVRRTAPQDYTNEPALTASDVASSAPFALTRASVVERAGSAPAKGRRRKEGRRSR